MQNSNKCEIYDTVIIGGGVVGLAVLREATLRGLKCALIEASPHILTKASGSNSGIACTGVDAAPGTLERALIRDSISRIRIFCKKHNVPMRECGSLVCLWPWDTEQNNSEISDTGSPSHLEEEKTAVGHLDKDYNLSSQKLLEVACESWEAGDTQATILDQAQVLEKEPALSCHVKGAVHIPGEIVLDPWLYPIALASHARENGAQIYTSFPFDPLTSSFNKNTKLWTIPKPQSLCIMSSSPHVIKAKCIVNAAGIQSDLIHLQSKELPTPLWKAKPRRGQYRIFSYNRNHQPNVLRHPIQPVPTPRTKGIFVFSTLYNQIVVGPTALDQESRTDVTPNDAVAQQLTNHAQRILDTSILHTHQQNDQNDNKNNFEETDKGNSLYYIGEYVGIRPGCNHRDYQIHCIPEKRWISAAGIRSTGLTASLGIGSYVMNLLRQIISIPELGSKDDSGIIVPTKLTPLQDVKVLAQSFRDSKDGCVNVNGHSYKVTHPITKLGWTHGIDVATTT